MRAEVYDRKSLGIGLAIGRRSRARFRQFYRGREVAAYSGDLHRSVVQLRVVGVGERVSHDQ